MKNRIYFCPAGVEWVKNTDGILVINRNQSQSYLLMGLESAVWSWMSLSYTYPRLVGMLSELEGISRQEAGQKLKRLLEAWRVIDILEVRETSHG